MTIKLTARRFRTRAPDLPAADAGDEALFDNADDGFGESAFPTAAAAAAAPPPAAEITPPAEVASETEIEAIRREGLTGRQLRLARRIAQKHGLPATSDFDAVRLLRRAGIDPFQRGSMLELVMAGPAGAEPAPDRPAGPSTALTTTDGAGPGPQLPETFRPARLPSPEVRVETNHAAELLRVREDIARRRRRKSILMTLRLALFVGLPTLLCGWYFYVVATPLYATHSEFVIQQSQNPAAGAGAMGGLFQGSPLATQTDSTTVQGYLQSREAMQRLDADLGFRAHFARDDIDPIARLEADSSQEDAYRAYKRNVIISYDPSEGIIKMEVIAADPATSAAFARALIGYAEEQVDQLTQRMREGQMQGARDSYVDAEAKMLESQRRVVELQEQFKVLSSDVEVQLISTQITQLETMLTQDKLSLSQMEANARPNAARMQPIRDRIARLESEIAALRAKLTEDDGSGTSLARVQGELLVAQADVQTRQLILTGAVQAMEAARVEANRQVRYLSVSVAPVPPDEPTYPRAFENTLVAMLIFAGIYLMISMTVAILREQVSA
jgi:capsular polysaccharide transport system permease protein